jgi:SAM-dependent methyltransferase
MINRGDLSYISSDVNPLKLKLLEDYLVSGSCLDVGCGNGLYGGKILERCYDLLQIDLIDRRVPNAKQYPFRALDANRIDLIDQAFDNVVAFDVMEHLEDDSRFLQDLHRVCRGRLILSVPNADDEQPRNIGLTHMHHVDKTHRREYSKESLQAALQKNGFRVLEIRPHYNERVFYAARALAKGTFLSRVAAKTIYWQNLFYKRIGLFENRCIGDWFSASDCDNPAF